jgi:hypothetical protein
VRSPGPAARVKRVHFKRLIFLLPLVAATVIVNQLQAVPAAVIIRGFEGFGIALCAVAFGVVLIWRVTRAMAMEQRLQDQPPLQDQACISPSEPNPAEPQRTHSSSPPEAATAPAAPVASLSTESEA